MDDWTDDDEQALVRDEAEALAYAASFDWSPPLDEISHVDGVPGIVSVFQVKFLEPIRGSHDDRLWIVVGDLPSAYLVVEAGDGAQEVLYEYCNLMEDWVVAVRAATDLNQVFPVRAEPTLEMADLLNRRIALLRQTVIPWLT
jgi:hypothetical protein